MFEQLLREIDRLKHIEHVRVSIPADAEAYVDRRCPSSDCHFEFKVHEDDWRHKVRDEAVFCPFCGHRADAQQWFTPHQIAYTKNVAIAELHDRIGSALRRDANAWNRRQPHNAFVRINMQVKNPPRTISLPPAAAATMQLKIACPACACRYAVIGCAFFCPACGHNAADITFNQALDAISRTLDAIPDIRAVISDRDAVENTIRLLIENALQNSVTAFQRYAEALYAKFPQLPVPRRNAFQNLKEGSDLWKGAVGKYYGDYLEPAQRSDLARFFQQRHLLAHTQGLVDDDYIARTGDKTYRVGQRLVIRETVVRECLALVRKLATAMTSDAQQTKE